MTISTSHDRAFGVTEVELTPEEMRRAAYIGCDRQCWALAAGAKHLNHRERQANPLDEWTQNIHAAGAELALAKWMGIPWEPPDGPGDADVGPYEVRWTKYDHGHLQLQPKDVEAKGDRLYYLVTGLGPRYTLRGWILGAQADNPKKYWRNPNQNAKATDPRYCFYVPQSDLYPVDPIGTETHQ